MQKLIGIMGQKGSGKDTVADYIIRKYDDYSKRSLAEPLKRACQEIFLFSDEQMYGTQSQKEEPDNRWFGCSPRTCLQYVGTDLLRDQMNKIMPGIEHDIFTHHFELWYVQNKGNVIVPDVRFENEVKMIRNLGGYVIKIIRPSLIQTDMHSSEIASNTITNYDYLIWNDGSIEDLHKKVDSVMDQINARR